MTPPTPTATLNQGAAGRAKGMDTSSGAAASDVARAYVDAVEGGMNGEILAPASSDDSK